MQIRCSNCSCRYRVADEHGGRWGRCSQCDHRFILPIPDPEQLLEWAQTAPWNRLVRFISNFGAAGHGRDTVDALTRAFEQRRWVEEERARREGALAEGRPALSRRERIWAASDRRVRQRHTLEELRGLTVREFECFVADLFNAQEYTAHAVGGTADNGIDVEVFSSGSLWGVVQCKRYGVGVRVSAGEVRDFAGAYLLSGAPNGFLFTTGRFTKHARRTARGYPWLKTYNGGQLVKYVEAINGVVDDATQ